jgi:hypothetical protein
MNRDAAVLALISAVLFGPLRLRPKLCLAIDRHECWPACSFAGLGRRPRSVTISDANSYRRQEPPKWPSMARTARGCGWILAGAISGPILPMLALSTPTRLRLRFFELDGVATALMAWFRNEATAPFLDMHQRTHRTDT